ncbi:MAG: DUF473 family protein [Methanospirillum sp.]|nr:DUF473 family protein [Methanospirillum sp.]
MEIPALTSLSPEILRELKRGLPRTLEVQSAHNVITIANIEPGDHVFMTSVDSEDLYPGDRGILVDVLSIAVSMKRLIEFSSGTHYEERERTSVRVQVRYCADSTVKSVVDRAIFGPTRVDVVRAPCCHAG